MSQSQIVENSLYTTAIERANLINNKSLLTDAFLINVFGFLSLYKINDKRGNMKHYESTEGKLQLSNISDTNHDVSLVIKLAYEAGIIQLAAANDLTRLLFNLKNKTIKGADINDDLIRGILANIKYASHTPTPAVKSAVDRFADKTHALTLVAPDMWTAAKANKHLQPVIAEFKDIIVKGQYQELFTKMRAGAPVVAQAVAAHVPVVVPPNGDRYVVTVGGRNAFWHVAVDGDVMVTHYGRIGTDGVRSHKIHPSASAAQSALKSALKEKLGKGYVSDGKTKVDMTAPAASSTTQPVTPTSSSAVPAVTSPKGPSLTFMQELMGKWDTDEQSITDTFKKYGVPKTTTKAAELASLIKSYTDFQSLRYQPTGSKLLNSGLIQTCIKNQNLKAICPTIGDVFMANSFEHGAKASDLTYMFDAVKNAQYSTGTRINLAQGNQKVRDHVVNFVPDYANAVYQALKTAVIDNGASFSVMLREVNEVATRVATITAAYGLRARYPQGILMPAGADKFTLMMFWLAFSPVTYRETFADATHYGPNFALNGLSGANDNFTGWLTSEIRSACPGAVVTQDGGFGYYNNGAKLNVIVLKSEAGNLPEHINRLLTFPGVNSSNKFAINYTVVDSADTPQMAEAAAGSVYALIKNEGSSSVNRWSDETINAVKSFVNMAGSHDAFVKVIESLSSYNSIYIITVAREYIKSPTYIDAYNNGGSAHHKLNDAEHTKLIRMIMDGAFAWMAGRDDSGSGYTCAYTVVDAAQYAGASNNDLAKACDVLVRGVISKNHAIMMDMRRIDSSSIIKFFKWVVTRAPEALPGMPYALQLLAFNQVGQSTDMDFPAPKWDNADDIKQACDVLGSVSRFLSGNWESTALHSYIKSLSATELTDLVTKASGFNPSTVYHMLMWAAIVNDASMQVVLDGIQVRQAGSVHSTNLQPTFDYLYNSDTGMQVLNFINKTSAKLSDIIRVSAKASPSSLGASVSAFTGSIDDVKPVLNEFYLSSTTTALTGRMGGGASQRVITAAVHAVDVHKDSLSGDEIAGAIMGVTNAMLKDKTVFDKSFRDSHIDDMANVMISISNKDMTKADAAYGKLSGEAKRAIIDKLSSEKFMQVAKNRITDKSAPIKPFMALDDARIKKMLEFNRVDIPTVRANSAAGAKFSELMKVVNDFEKIISHPKVTPVNDKIDATARETLLERKSVEYDKFNKYRHGMIAIKFIDEFDVSIPEQVKGQAKFVNEHPGTHVMDPVFHGTGSVAASMILRYGFAVIKSNDSSVVGRMLGDGIYFSTVLDKVSQYTSDAGYTRGIGTKGYIFQMSSAMGKKNHDYREAGTGNDSIRSPEWCVFSPNEQLLIKKAFLVEIISKDAMLALKKKHAGVNEDNVMEIRTFKEFLRESDAGFTQCTTYTFMDGMIPMADGTYLDFEDVNLKLPAHVTIEPSAMGPMLCINHNESSSQAFCVSNTFKFVNGEEFGAYASLLNSSYV